MSPGLGKRDVAITRRHSSKTDTVQAHQQAQFCPKPLCRGLEPMIILDQSYGTTQKSMVLFIAILFVSQLFYKI